MEPCTIEEAACFALRDFLQAQFDADSRFNPELPDERCIVRGEWPQAGDNLPRRCISITPAGERRDTHLTEEVVQYTEKPNNQGEFTWVIKGISQPIQLDVWGIYEEERSLILRALDRFLNMGPRFTLGAGDLTRDGLLLLMDPASGHEGHVDCTFEGPRRINGEAELGEHQFRALIRGELDAMLLFTATTAKLARIKLQMAIGEGAQPQADFTLQKVDGVFKITSATL